MTGRRPAARDEDVCGNDGAVPPQFRAGHPLTEGLTDRMRALPAGRHDS